MTLVIAAVFSISAQGQGFLNLNFESAQNLPASPPKPNGDSVPVTNALPGWAAYGSGEPYSDINYVSSYFSGYSTEVELEGGSLALSGEFSVGLVDGGSISQTGLVPADAESLQFEASLPAINLSVTLGGQSLSYSILSQGTGYAVYGANIPAALDGQTEALTFGVNGLAGQSLLDNIEFSTSSVPEPAEWAMVGVGALLLGFWRRRKRERFG